MPAPRWPAPGRPAPAAAGRARGRRTVSDRAILAALIAFGAAAPCAAQLAGSLTIQNDYRFRGYSIDRGAQPVGIASLSYDHGSGLYAGVTAAGGFYSGDPVLVAATGNAGYATRITPRLSLDFGVTHTQFQGVEGRPNTHYTEIYAGLSRGAIAAHFYVSPDYLNDRVSTLYGEVEASHRLGNYRLGAHLGLLGYLRVPDIYGVRESQYDWRLSVSRTFGAFDVHAALSGGGPGYYYYRTRIDTHTAVTIGLTWSL